MRRLLVLMSLLTLSAVVMATTPATNQSLRASGRNIVDANGRSLNSVLAAAAERKRAGTSVVLPVEAHLHGRPTADLVGIQRVPAGTVVRRNNQRLTNAAGNWRHVSLGDNDGWILEAELPED